MRRIFFLLLCGALLAVSCTMPGSRAHNTMSAPCYPLVTIDPYTSIWAFGDDLAGRPTSHWTGRDYPLLGVMEVDGVPYRFLGRDSDPRFDAAARQMSVEVLPTATYYEFECAGVEMEVIFTAPFLPGDLELVSRPVNYVTYRVKSADGRKHAVKVYLEASPLLAQNDSTQTSRAFASREGDLTLLKTGTLEQDILGKKGDDVRIDWGYFCMSSLYPAAEYGVGEASALRDAFLSGERMPEAECRDGFLAVVDSHPASKSAEGVFLIGYDDIFSVNYFGEKLRPYWNRTGEETIDRQFVLAGEQYESVFRRCVGFDNAMMKEAVAAGGEKYASLCALAYRQAYAAHKLCVSSDGEIHWLSKENFSNGSIGTVDVTYPSAPLFLIYNVELAKGLLNHIFHYSESGLWDKPFAAHDVGTYPIATGQTYGGDMPIEESGNMVILTAAVARAEGNADYALKHWNTLTTWTDYLVDFGLDPGNQLCTDDFAGHFAHNANLSVKAIEAIGAYALLADMSGKADVARKYRGIASGMASKWVDMARDGDHFKLTFDAEGTWSLKYNLVWDKLLGLDLFPEEVAATELAYYKGRQNRYGVPLDCREDYTKSDWIVWTATMAPDRETFEYFIEPIYLYMDRTEDRVPLSDWTFTSEAVHRGFQARSVVGGYFMKMLSERWK
ncbi:MAG: DUF4965 domain-containing protein [Bacteroidales bacterium]|nr:DUF4965 domain-containing protein [Bacteroidales bacterium]